MIAEPRSRTSATRWNVISEHVQACAERPLHLNRAHRTRLQKLSSVGAGGDRALQIGNGFGIDLPGGADLKDVDEAGAQFFIHRIAVDGFDAVPLERFRIVG